MKIDFATLAFGYTLKSGGGTPNWATALGQGKDYKININPEIDEIIRGMVYKNVPLEKISAKIGKGGRVVLGNSPESPIILASVFDDVYINNIHINNGKFILLITKDTSESHTGRLRLKYAPNHEYRDGDNVYTNELFLEQAKNQLSLSNDACWFVTDISIKNQNQLNLTAIIVDDKNSVEYADTAHLHEEWNKFYGQNENIAERIIGGFNKIYYGVPGTGKSYEIDKMLENIEDENKIRITFHPDYTYNDFVGQLLPTVIKSGENAGDITYDFQKGPFTIALEKAYENPNKKIYLIIEEMSRGNCAAIFGDIFQLLDRKDNGESIYDIYNEIIAKDIPTIFVENGKIKIPSNLYIYGTVNTSDQNVFVMDTAFKRRFEWEYISTKPKKENNEYLNNKTLEFNNGENIIKLNWIDLYMSLNKFISSSEKLGLGEDKQIGQFFIKFNSDDYKEKIKNKLLHYLWFDIQESSYKSEIRLFDNNVTSFSDLYDMYDNNEKIFSDEFLNSINNL